MADLAITLPTDDVPTLGGPPLPDPTFAVTPAANVAPPPSIASTGPSVTPAGSYSGGIAGMESGGNRFATNPYFPVERGGPLGPHQFTRPTWLDFAKENPDLFYGMTPEQVLNARTDPVLSARATDWYAAKNKDILESHGIVATPGNLGIAHALGGAGAAGVLGLPDSTPLADAFKQTQPGMADAILAQNPGYRTMTVGDLRNKYSHFDQGQYGGNVQQSTQPAPAAAPPQAPAAPVAAAPVRTTSALENYRKLTLLNNLLSSTNRQAAAPASAYASSTTPWVNALLANNTQSNPLQTIATLSLLKNGGLSSLLV